MEVRAPGETPRPGPLSVHLEVQDFGPLKEASVQLRPLTVFVGPSNTGKTYLSLLVYALHDVFIGFPRLPISTMGFPVLGDDWELDDWELLKTEISSKTLRETIEKLTKSKQVRLSELPSDLYKQLMSDIQNPKLFKSKLLSMLQDCFDIELQSDLIRESSDRFSISLKVGDLGGDLWKFAMKSDAERASVHIEDIVLQPGGRSRKYLEEERFQSMFDSLEPGEKIHRWYWEEFLRLLFYPGKSEDLWAPGAFYLPAVRGGIMESHRIIASALVSHSTRAGFERMPQIPTLSRGVADFMRQLILYDKRDKRRRADSKIAKLAEDLEKRILSGKILINQSRAGGYPEFIYRPQGTKQDVKLNRASSMVSELAPVVLWMRHSIRPRDMLIIEEPEAHLHPAAQTQMAKTLAALVRVGVRVLVTTHSDWLLQEIANLVREGELRQAQGENSDPDASVPWLDAEEVGVWLFQNSQGRGGGATVKEIPFDRVDGLEPEDYADVAETLYNRSAELQNQLEETRIQEETANG